MKKLFILLFILLGNCLLIFGQKCRIASDIRVGELGSFPTDLIVYKNKLLFKASDDLDYNALWSYNGMDKPVKIYTNSDGFNNNAYCVYHNKLYFAKTTELWIYDGTNPPTKETDIIKGNEANKFIVFHDSLFFNSVHDSLGNEPFVYDGTTSPKLLFDIVPGITYSSPDYYTVFNDKLYFSTISNSIDLWVYEGGNPHAVNGSNDISPEDLVVFKANLIFSAINKAGRELWVYNGKDNPIMLFDLDPDSTIHYDPFNHEYIYTQNYSNPRHFCIFNDSLYFVADKQGKSFLWKYDSINGPTTVSESDGELISFNDHLFFVNNGLWQYDGVNPPEKIIDSIQPTYLTIFNNKLYFSADDHKNYGTELWVYDPLDTSVKNITQQICQVTFDNATGKNAILWERSQNKEIKEYEIYKETAIADEYAKIGTVPFSSDGKFVDQGSNPAKQAYRYKLGTVLTDGKISGMSNFHQTIHLAISKGAPGYYNLNWTPYVGFDFQTYYLFKGSTPNNLELFDSISSNQLQYTDKANGITYYRIIVRKNNLCNYSSLKSAFYFDEIESNIQSNIDLYSNIKQESLYIAITPNPYNDHLIIESDINKPSIVKIEIYSLLGAKIYEYSTSKCISGNYKKVIQSSELINTSKMNILKVTIGDKIYFDKIIKH